MGLFNDRVGTVCTLSLAMEGKVRKRCGGGYVYIKSERGIRVKNRRGCVCVGGGGRGGGAFNVHNAKRNRYGVDR